MKRRTRGYPRLSHNAPCLLVAVKIFGGWYSLRLYPDRRGAWPNVAPFGAIRGLHEADAACLHPPAQLRLRPFPGDNPLLQREAVPHERLSSPVADEHNRARSLFRHRADALDLALKGLGIFRDFGAESPASYL